MIDELRKKRRKIKKCLDIEQMNNYSIEHKYISFSIEYLSV